MATTDTLAELPGERRGRFAAWTQTQHLSGWLIAITMILAVMLLPVAAILVLAFNPSANAWPHLAATVLPGAAANTLLLAAGTGGLSLVAGTATAWLVTMYRFPCRTTIDRLLVIPLAMPTYIVAYCYVELMDYAGPLQSTLRSAFGWKTVGDYWFPDIRSLPGATVIFASVLYPYVYLSARASFVQQSVCALEVARTLGRTPLGTFWSVALPLARPALAAGVALVVMETFNDLGAVQYLGIETLTASIYATWVQRSNLSGAAQIATVMLSFVFILLLLERWQRGSSRSHHTTGRYRAIPFEELSGWKAAAAALFALIPFVLGFVLPATVLVGHTLTHLDELADTAFLTAAFHTLMLASLAAAITVALAIVLAYARRISGAPPVHSAVRLSGLGYAVPGTVLAIGLLIPLAAADNTIDAGMQSAFGISTGLLFSGSLFAITLAYVIRFLTVALGGVEAGLERISPNLDSAARTLGETAFSTLRRIHLPLLAPALGAAALLVFVDVMKELPATLLLRPFNVETLATHVYSLSGIEQFERASPGALLIVLAGLIPLLLLHNAIATGRAGRSGKPGRVVSSSTSL
ncbi:MAG: iron ABC transporter permease [Hyphomicrobiaceae bacterium]|nr:iron ABC transporter permease [Hyphomicrobiaceae bacterium]